MSPLHSRLALVREKIEELTALYQRPAGSVRLIAVSKQHTVDKVVEAARLDQRDIAENYVQEGIEKIGRAAQMLSGDTPAALCWHFIGHIQSRKCRLIAENFNWVHSVDSLKVADKLNRQRAGGAPLDVLIQLNPDREEAKSGVSEQELPPLAGAIAALPNLRLRGLMMIPKPEKAFDKQRAAFRRCRELRDELNARGFTLDHLSMGMTNDMEAAIAEGATMVRIGTALFGPRPAKAIEHSNSLAE